MQNYLVYQAYGSIDILHECMYSILSFYKTNPNSDTQIVIYTDAKPYLHSYLGQTIIYQEIDQNRIHLWQGDINFVHRVKIKMLQDFIVNHKGNILYTDTDTVFCSDVANIY